MIEAVQALAAGGELTQTLNVTPSGTQGTDFSSWLTQQIESVNQQVQAGEHRSAQARAWRNEQLA